MKKNSKNNKKLIDIVLPNKPINFFIVTILILGVISGSIFLMISNETDKSSVITQIENFFKNISDNSINNGLALKNSLIINYLFIATIWILGLSMVGIIANIFITYIKGFLVGFSISSIFLTYGYKGLLATLLYTFPSQIINVVVVSILSIYSVMFAKNLFQIIISKKTNNRLMLKKYFVILIMCIIFSFISSLLEVYIFPNLLKLVIKYYI